MLSLSSYYIGGSIINDDIITCYNDVIVNNKPVSSTG